MNIKNLSYDKVKIKTKPESTIIYLDPPYKDTSEYKIGGFDHDKLLEDIKNMAEKGYTVYVSSYSMPSPLELVYDYGIIGKATDSEKLYVLRPKKNIKRKR